MIWLIDVLMTIGLMVICTVVWYMGYTVGKWDGKQEAKNGQGKRQATN